MQHLNPTGSYCIDVPDSASENIEDRVISFWLPGKTLLLQLSSYSRHEGAQISAADRLAALLKRQPLSAAVPDSTIKLQCPDFASVSGVDGEGCQWIYAYAVWDTLALMITISGEEKDLRNNGNWAYAAARSITRS